MDRRKLIKKSDVLDIIEFYEAGISIVRLAKKFDVGESALRGMLRRNHVKIRNRKEARAFQENETVPEYIPTMKEIELEKEMIKCENDWEKLEGLSPQRSKNDLGNIKVCKLFSVPLKNMSGR